MDKLFETATRNKYRYPYSGNTNTEWLWDMSVEQLDAIYKALNAEVKQEQEDSLLVIASDEDTELTNKIKIVKYIFAVKLAEIEARENEADRRAQKQKLLGVLERKQNAALEDLTPEEIQEMIANL